MSERFDVVIVGAGHGGAQAAIALRQRRFEGTIAIIGDETELPYERPPLSKDYLARDKPFERLLIRPATFWQDRQITMLTGRAVVGVEAGERRVVLAGGRVVGYGTLIWAAGGRPRRLSCTGGDLAGVHAIRTRADVDRLMVELPRVARVAVVGGGYIGLEAAAVLSKLGKQVIVLEAQDRVLARVAGAPLSRFYEAEHRAHGVEIRLGVTVACIEERDGAACGVRLGDDTVLPCGMVIVGIGIEPAIEPLAAAGAAVGNGVVVDRFCRTSLPDVFAIGDCAAHPNPHAGGATIRLESVQNANDQAMTVAKRLTGTEEPYDAMPWFWSNQYDLKLQTVGLSTGFEEAVVRGDPATRRFAVAYLAGGRLIAVDAVNATRDYVQARALIAAGTPVEAARIADAGLPLKEAAA